MKRDNIVRIDLKNQKHPLPSIAARGVLFHTLRMSPRGLDDIKQSLLVRVRRSFPVPLEILQGGISHRG
jgi:hypothetical protein